MAASNDLLNIYIDENDELHKEVDRLTQENKLLNLQISMSRESCNTSDIREEILEK